MRRALIALVLVPAALAGCGGSDKTSDDSAPIRLPDQVGDLRDIVQASEAASAKEDALAALRERQTAVADLTIKRYEAAYDGAAVAFRAYADAGLETLVSVIAVRADAPGPTFGPVNDARALGLAKAPDEVVTAGDAECHVHWDPVPQGQEPEDEAEHVVACQQTADGVTVFVFGSGLDGQQGLDTASAVAADALEGAQ